MKGEPAVRNFHGVAVLAACSLISPIALAAPVQALDMAGPLQHLPALAGEYFPMNSKATGSLYHIYIRLPEGYSRATQRYPVVYLLDGDSSFPYLAPHHLFLSYDDKLPEAIIVGIAYGSFEQPVNRRGIDFGEQAAKFHSFLKTELIPEIERRTRSDPSKRILVGQSFGGGFVLYSAYTDPDLFWGRIASNPSFPTHTNLLLSAPPTATSAEVKLVVASGTDDRPRIRAGVLQWLEAHGRRPGPWQFQRLELQGGTHAADLPNAYRQAMSWLFRLR